MARPLRIEFEGAVYHVTSRGNRREHIYEDDGDRERFLSVLAGVVARFGWLCHGYCLMGNHYHLIVETPEANLSRGMRQLNGVYTQRYNVRHGRVGHVFQGRYKAVVVEKERHLLELCRYVVLNPVRAGMAAWAGQWQWSNYRATAGLRKSPEFLSTDWVLSQFGRSRTEAQREYRQFVREGIEAPSPWEGLVGGLLLGSEQFVAECRAHLLGDKQLQEVPRASRFTGRPTLEDLFRHSHRVDRARRNKLIAEAYRDHGYTMKHIGNFLGLHYTTVSRLIKAQEEGI